MSADSTELIFVQCPSCRSLVPAMSTRCRMCGAALDPAARDENGESASGSQRVRQRTTQLSPEQVAASTTPEELDPLSAYLKDAPEAVVEQHAEATGEAPPVEASSTPPPPEAETIPPVVEEAPEPETPPVVVPPPVEPPPRVVVEQGRQKSNRPLSFGGSGGKRDDGRGGRSDQRQRNGGESPQRRERQAEAQPPPPPREERPRSARPMPESKPPRPTEPQRRLPEGAAPQHAARLVGWFVSYSRPEGEAIELREGKCFISRESLKPRDIVVQHPSLSTPHALLQVRGSGLSVQDLMSDTGVAVRSGDGASFESVTDVVTVESGDTIRCGEVEFEVVLLPERLRR